MGKGNTKILIIVGIIAAFALAWYKLADDSAKAVKEYNKYITAAREKRSVSLHEDAIDNYNLALVTKESLELREEIADYYGEMGKTDDYIKLCDLMVEKYPTAESGYQRLVNYYLEKKNYGSVLSLINNAKKRGVVSKTMMDIEESLKYEYEYIKLGFEKVSEYSGGIAAVKSYEGNWGYVSPSGNGRVGAGYLQASIFNGAGFAAVQNKNGEFRIIDTTGRDKHVDVEKKKIEECLYILEDKIAVKYNGKYHYCDIDFKELFGSYDYAGSFYQGIAAVKDGEKWYFIKPGGDKYIDQEFDEIVLNEKGISFRNNVAFVKKDGKYYLIDKSGNKVGTETWEAVDAFNSEEPAAVFNGNRWGFVDNSGNMVRDYEYDCAKSFFNGFAAVEKDDKWGYIIVSDFTLKIDYAFKEANDFNYNGSAFVQKDKGWDLIKIYSYNY